MGIEGKTYETREPRSAPARRRRGAIGERVNISFVWSKN